MRKITKPLGILKVKLGRDIGRKRRVFLGKVWSSYLRESNTGQKHVTLDLLSEEKNTSLSRISPQFQHLSKYLSEYFAGEFS